MSSGKQQQLLKEYLTSKNLRHSEHRSQILDVFLKTERHLTAEELYNLAKKRIPSIGYATIYRALKLFCDCGLCRELKLDDGITRYEHRFGHEHHDHLICLKCGKFEEVMSPEIEKLQEKLAKEKGFVLKRHRLELYGICKKCRK